MPCYLSFVSNFIINHKTFFFNCERDLINCERDQALSSHNLTSAVFLGTEAGSTNDILFDLKNDKSNSGGPSTQESIAQSTMCCSLVFLSGFRVCEYW